MSFDIFNLHPKILKAVAKAGYVEPTEIQQRAIPVMMSGADMRASAQTGTGKTAAFMLPALHRLATSSDKAKGPKILILAPTRELAMQIAEQAEKYSKFMDRTKTVCVVGGVSYHVQLRQLARPYEILIATPGRLIDFIERRKIDLSYVELLVLDEADRMLDMGFLEPVEEIVANTPENRQTLLFSATLQGSILKLSERLMNNPEEVLVHAQHAKHASISQTLHYVDDLHHKNRLLNYILDDNEINNAIVFTATKRHADQLVGELKERNISAAALHGDLNQRQRTRTIDSLRKGKFKILVATDVAARGIDVNTITHVINYDLPRNPEDYVHRIGRTGRAGAKGIAISFAARRDVNLVNQVESFTRQKINVVEIPGFEPRSPKHAPKKSSHFQRKPGKPGGFGRSSGGKSGKPNSFGKPGRFSNSERPSKFGSSDRSERSGKFGSSDKPERSSRSFSKFGSSDRPERSSKFGSSDKPERSSRSFSKFGSSDRSERSGKFGSSDKPERSSRSFSKFGSSDRSERSGKFGSSDKPERSSRSFSKFGSSDRSERSGKFGSSDKSERSSRSFSKFGSSDKSERSGKSGKFSKSGKPGKFGRSEKPGNNTKAQVKVPSWRKNKTSRSPAKVSA